MRRIPNRANRRVMLRRSNQCTVMTVQYASRSVNAGGAPTNPGSSRRDPRRGRAVRLVAMTSQAMGDEQDPPADQPGPAAGPALNPLQRLIQQRLREQGWSYREVARRGGLPHSTIHTLAATRNLGLAIAPGHHRRAGQGPGRAGLGGPRRRRGVHRDALLRRDPRRKPRPM